MNMVYVREKMMCNMIIKTSKNKIRYRAEWMKVIWAFYLVVQPGSFYVAIIVGIEIFGLFNVVCHKKSEQQK